MTSLFKNNDTQPNQHHQINYKTYEPIQNKIYVRIDKNVLNAYPYI